jgi:hypothetical protein
MNLLRTSVSTAIIIATAVFTVPAMADPLPGEVLKFQQLPLNVGLPPSNGGAPYAGHNETSTAYANFDATGQFAGWRGTYMADDFGDKVSTPVVHVRWWGSYDQNLTGANGVPQFLISFESDVAAQPGTFSHPGSPILNQIVRQTSAPLTPGSGTFQEKMINGGVPEHLYEYNAELSVPFNEAADSVYWLKIVALVNPPVDGNISWGWHDRDWSLQDTYASTTGLSTPGERVIGTVPGTTGTSVSVWHYQDDAVSGPIDILPVVPGGLFVDQHQTWVPQNYKDSIDGPPGIGAFSKDLAFELYTVPEPTTVLLFAVGTVAITLFRLRRGQKAA